MRGTLVAWIVGLAATLVCAACATHPPLSRVRADESAGCSSAAPPAAPRLTAWRALPPVHDRAPIRFAPGSAPAARYNDPAPPVPHSALGDAVIAAVQLAAARAGLPAPTPDARLFQACADLAEVVPEARIARLRLDDALVEFALQRHGLIEPAVRLLFGWGDPAQPEGFVRELAPRLAEALRDGPAVRVGVGVALRGPDGLGAIVFALQGSAVSTRPIPRDVARDRDIVVDAVLDPRFHDPEVFVTHPGGDTEQAELRPGPSGGFVAQLACSAPAGRRQIEIVASDASGATVLANFPVWCAAEPPRAMAVEPPADPAVDTPVEAERALLDAIDRDRAAAGLPVLRRDPEVAAVARAHAEDMRASHAVAHISATTGAAIDRLRAAGIDSRLVLENVARAPSPGVAHRALMNSPGHRANILSADATDVGVGVAFDAGSGRRELFIAQLFTRAAAAPPPGSGHCAGASPGPARVAAAR